LQDALPQSGAVVLTVIQITLIHMLTLRDDVVAGLARGSRTHDIRECASWVLGCATPSVASDCDGRLKICGAAFAGYQERPNCAADNTSVPIYSCTRPFFADTISSAQRIGWVTG